MHIDIEILKIEFKLSGYVKYRMHAVRVRIVSKSLDKPNLIYRVQERTTKDDAFSPLVRRLKKERTKMARVIIFCRRCKDCAAIYEFFLSYLKDEFTEPVGAPNLTWFRLVDVYRIYSNSSRGYY